MSSSVECALERGFHAPRVVAADHQNAHRHIILGRARVGSSAKLDNLGDKFAHLATDPPMAVLALDLEVGTLTERMLVAPIFEGAP